MARILILGSTSMSVPWHFLGWRLLSGLMLGALTELRANPPVPASASSAPLECAFGQPDLIDQLPSASELEAAADRLKEAAKAEESARNERTELMIQAVESALMAQSVGKDPTPYWTLIKTKLADTRWRLAKRAKTGDAQARWVYAELSQFEAKPAWALPACRELGQFSPEQPSDGSEVKFAGALYRHALCESQSSPEKGLQLMRRAADAGHPAAQEAYGRLCAEQGGEGKACAVKYLCLAADAGRVSAAGLAAFLLTEQKPSAALAVKAAALYEKSVNSGDFASANNLGEVYERGWIGSVNLIKAQYFYKLAAESGVVEAQLNLARLIYPENKALALEWLAKASVSMPAAAAKLKSQLEQHR
jgi:TPR repeat protein